MKKRSWTDLDLINAVKNSISIREVILKLKLIPAGGTFNNIKRSILEAKLDMSHFLGKGHRKGSMKYSNAELVEEAFTIKSKCRRATLKLMILQLKLLDYECSECGQGTEWLDKPLTLVLDHINGVPNDHRLENLRLLCPNCDSQQPTFRGIKGRKKDKIIPPKRSDFERDYNNMITSELEDKYEVNTQTIYKWKTQYGIPSKTKTKTKDKKECALENCNNIVLDSRGKYCSVECYKKSKTNEKKECASESCNNIVPSSRGKYCSVECYKLTIKKDGKPDQRKIKNRPTKETLQELINNHSFSGIGRMYRVSDNAVRKWCKFFNIVKNS